MFLLMLALAAVTISPEGVTAVTAESTVDDLAVLFGEENLEETREHLGEGFYSEGTLIFGGTDNELSVVWDEGRITEVRVTGTSSTPEGISLGSTLIELEEVIGPFQMAGFAWDCEGYVNLESTIYEGLYIRLTPTGETPERFMGDELFSSSEMRELNPVVTDLRILF